MSRLLHFLQIDSQMAMRLVVRASRPSFTHRKISGTPSVKGLVDPRVKVLLEGLCESKSSMISL
jgi:hypothetical protein